MAKTVLPKDVKLPKFAGEKSEEKAVTKPSNQPAKVEEPTPVGLPENIEDYEYLLKPMQPMIKGWRIFFPYFFAFLYNLFLVVALVALLALPIVKLQDASAIDAFYAAGEFPFDLKGLTDSIFSTVGLSEKLTGLYSIAEIGYAVVLDNIKGGINGILVAASQMFGFVSMAILLVIMLIWFVVKFVISILSLLSLIFKHKRHKIVDNFFFKNTHQYYKLGLLDRDRTFIVFLIYTIFLWGFMNIKAILAMVGVSNKIIDGIVIFKVFENTDVMNFGNILLICVIGALLLFRIIYRSCAHGLSRKIRKMYVLKKRRRRKAA